MASLSAIMIVVGFSADPSKAQGQVREVHGEWEIRCETPPGAPKESCSMIQSVVAENRKDIGLTVIVLKSADGKATILQVLAPLGVLLPSELGLFLDAEDHGRVRFLKCTIAGCFAQVFMDDKLIGEFESGNLATFTIFQTPEEGIGIPIRLDGFKEAYAALNNL
ncbi:MAG: invasion associated locus B family protein [Pseudomonadota bacterium]